MSAVAAPVPLTSRGIVPQRFRKIKELPTLTCGDRVIGANQLKRLLVVNRVKALGHPVVAWRQTIKEIRHRNIQIPGNIP